VNSRAICHDGVIYQRHVSDSLRFRVPLIISSLMTGVLVLFLLAAHSQVEQTLVHAGEVRAQAASDQLAGAFAQSALQQLNDVQRIARSPALQDLLQHPGHEPDESVIALLTTLSLPRQPVELWNAAGQRLLTVPRAAETFAPMRPMPGPAVPPTGVSPLCVEGDVTYWQAVADVQAESQSGGPPTKRLGAVVTRRVLTAGSSVAVVDHLVGTGAVVNVGNRTGTTWSNLSNAVRGPTIDAGRSGVASYRGDDRTPRLGAASPIAGTPWIIRVEFPREAVTAPARTFLSRMASMAAVFVALSAFTAYGLVGRIERRAADVRAMNATLQARVAELGALSRELEAFSYSVSHDLRAPLRQVVGSTGMLEKSAGPSLGERDLRYVRTISDAATRMGRLIDELLTFSRMERREMLHADVDLAAMVESLREDAMGDIGERTVNWTVHPLPVVQGDPSMLRQAFANLISNALKYTGTRGVAEIEIGASRPPGEHVIYVRDNGVGFDMQHAGKLFGVFQRLHRAEEFEGTGVGLASVRRIVARHGGRVWAEGAVDRGATFFVSLPNA